MKIFAFFLPQFHEIEENNKWWGKGFTDWTSVKNAKPLFEGHVQPIHPLNNKYYDLMEKDVVIWQDELRKQYRVDGMIYYHYYFKGKMLLEKPAENLLKWKDVKTPFFFCWANHDWNRSWRGEKTLLQKQEYGVQEDWENHFQYLLSFFKDDRYEKNDGMPLLMIFNSDFLEKNALFEYFDQRCKEEGFRGLYLIETFKGNNTWPTDYYHFVENKSSITKRIFLREYTVSNNIFPTLKKYYPVRLKNKLKKLIRKVQSNNNIDIYDGNINYEIMRDIEPNNAFVIHGIAFDWDNTPRHGTRGFIVDGPDRIHFSSFMNRVKDTDYLFVNAWNEWAEGMTLEPSEEKKYKYLEWIRDWKQNQPEVKNV